MDEFQCKLNSQPHSVCCECDGIICKEWDLISWREDLWEDPNKYGAIKPLNSDESYLPWKRPAHS